MSVGEYRYNSPPNWPVPSPDWRPDPGWVPDPAWGPAPDGWEFWVHLEPEVAPVPPPPGGWAPAEPVKGSPDNAVAWLVALAPLLFVLIDAGLYLSHTVSADTAGLFVALAVNVGLVVWDSRLLRRSGYAVPAGLGILLIPVYLFTRARRAGQSLAIPVTWIGAMALSIVGGMALTAAIGPVKIDMVGVETYLAQQLDQQADTKSTVDCPDRDTYYEGDTFDCRASDSSGAIIVRVTIQDNADGTYMWVPVGPAS